MTGLEEDRITKTLEKRRMKNMQKHKTDEGLKKVQHNWEEAVLIIRHVVQDIAHRWRRKGT